MPERSDISAVDAWREAVEFLDQGLPFHAHEVFEQRWKCCPEGERDAWRALAQWGAALTQRARGNEIGQRRIALRARNSLLDATTQNTVPEVIDVDRVMDSLAQLT